MRHLWRAEDERIAKWALLELLAVEPAGWLRAWRRSGASVEGGLSIYRAPAAETEDYPGLIVHDDRVTGSITTGKSRLPLWAFISQAMVYGWEQEAKPYDPEQYGWTKERMGEFLYNLLDQRGEFARLICILADVERRDRPRGPAWWEKKRQTKRVLEQLRRCVVVLGVEA